VEEATTSERTKQSPEYLVDPVVWRAFAAQFTRLWKEQMESPSAVHGSSEGRNGFTEMRHGLSGPQMSVRSSSGKKPSEA